MKIEKAMILAAGRGERMLPLSRDLPKPLFRVGETTLIQRHLRHLAAAGIKFVVINIHYLGQMIMDALGDEQFGMEITYSQESELLETAGGIRAALPLLGHSPFLVINGDIFTDFDFAGLLRRMNHQYLPHLVMVPNPAHHAGGDFCLNESGQLSSKGDEFLTYSGIGVYQADFFAGHGAGKQMLRPLFNAAIRENRIYGEVFRGVWSDVGTPERYAALKSQGL